VEGGDFMGAQDIGSSLLASINAGLLGLVGFLQSFIAGLIVLIVGIIIAGLLRQVVLEVLKALRVEAFLKRYGVPEARGELRWSNILSEIVRWFVIILFLIPAVKVWGVPEATSVLNQIILYIPRVFVATILALVGLVFGNLAHDVVLASVHGVSPDTSRIVATIARWSIIVFVTFGVLIQLGVAADLIRILFTGIIAMMALAGGIAFGLGGQTVAKEVLDALKKRLM
jgi:hypothetical protein